ncbi:UDP binding domain-containing protein [Pseudomonas sp. ANT_J28]|uniref:UDP binding domain-containing protein n=1 Tax=Pseudomonas sp. ANT_J28 TaxID=2597352 RepID=UPI003531AF92
MCYQFIYRDLVYGGACFPKDVLALIHTANSVDFDAQVLKADESRNNEQKTTLFNKILNHFDGAPHGKIFALWGLSVKPNTDDLRDAPSRELMEALWCADASVQTFDPKPWRKPSVTMARAMT